MKYLVPAMLILVGIIHAIPLSAALGGPRLAALYGLEFNEPNLEILMRHRAILFGLLGSFLIFAAFKPPLHTMALVAGFISVVSFLVLAGTVGGYNAKLGRVFVADLVALGFLIVATGAHWVGQSGASEKDDIAIDRMSRGEYWNPLVPEFTVKDLQTSLAFYRAAGFTVRFQRADPPFAYLERGQAQVMLEQQHVGGWNVAPLDPPLGRGINFQIEVSDAKRALSALVAVGFTPYRGLKETWYRISDSSEEGQLEFLIQDPDGYLLRFAQVLGKRVSS